MSISSLWNALSHIPNDPIGVQYQWRKSNAERFFHRAVASHEKFQVYRMRLFFDYLTIQL